MRLVSLGCRALLISLGSIVPEAVVWVVRLLRLFRGGEPARGL